MMKFILFFLCLLAICPSSAKSLSIENNLLKVTLFESTGKITVLDKRINHLWKQPEGIPVRAVKITKATKNTISYQVVLKDEASNEIPLSIDIRLANNKAQFAMVASTKPNLAISSFDFIEPFVYNNKNAYMAIADWCDGHIYPCNIGYLAWL